MKRLVFYLCCLFLMANCGGTTNSGDTTAQNATQIGETTDKNGRSQDDFGTHEGDASGGGVNGSKLKPTTTEAVLKLLVKTETNEPVPGIVVKGVSTDGHKFYTPETDATGYTEILVPIGAQLSLTYLSLFQDVVNKQTSIPNEPHVTMKLTLTYTPLKPKPIEVPDDGKLIAQNEYSEPTLILEGVEFDTAKATLRPESFEHLEPVLEFLTYKPSAMIELSGHTDNVGNPKKNLKLSEDRANAVRDYLISKGIDGSRIIAVGYGQERPIASNDTESGRQINRRTEAKEIGK